MPKIIYNGLESSFDYINKSSDFKSDFRPSSGTWHYISGQIFSGGAYYTTTGAPTTDRQLANKKYVDDTVTAGGGFVAANYITSANSIIRFAGSSQINRSLVDSISSNLDSRIDSLFNWSSNKEIYYPSGIGAGLSGSYSAHRQDTTIHFTKSSLDDDYQGSSQALSKFTSSSQVNRTLLNLISSNLDSRIDNLFSWSSNALTLYGASSHTHGAFYGWSGATWFYSVSSNYLGHSSNRVIHYPSSQLLGWLNALYQESGTSSTSDVAWSGAYQFYAISSLFDTRLDSIFNYSANAKVLYADSGNVRFRFIGSSQGIARFAGSSQINRSLLNTISSNLDIRIDSLFGFSSNRGLYYPSSLGKNLFNFSSNARNIFVESGLSRINELADVDTISTSPSRDQVLKWNGTNWVPAAYNATFVFTIASFSDGESTTQLIGRGEWKAQDSMSCTATYNNGPPTTTWVTHAYNSTNYSKSGTCGEMTGVSDYEVGTNSTKAISYPADKDYYVRFRLSAQAGTDTDTETETAVTFRNYIYYGVLTKNTSISESDIEGLTGTLTHGGTPAGSYSINAGAGQYLILSYPASYTNIPSGSDYESDGGTGFLFNSIACAFSGHAYVSVTNSAGYNENYKVYASNLPNLGNHTLTTTTTTATINTIYYGITTKTSTYTEADVEGLSESSTTNTYDTVTWNTLTSNAGEYLLFCFPKRWGEKGTAYSFYDNATGFEASFLDAETVSITNANGWSEDFYVYRTVNQGFGSITIRTD